VVTKHLNEGESIVFHTRTHVKALLLPALVLIVAAGVVGYSFSKIDDHRNIWWTAIGAVAAVVVLVYSVWPFLTWLMSTYTVTDRRLTTHQGVITRTGHDIQLTRISDVSYEKGLLDRILGCGTLVVSDASDLGVRLPDVPRVAEKQRIIADLLYRGDEPGNDGT
jgi:uncharacterized membrane protein YdbT with pleckstrin-like domain